MRKLISIFAVAFISGCASYGGGQAPSSAEEERSSPKVDSLKVLEQLSVEMVHEMRLWAKSNEARTREVLTDKQAKERFFQATYTPAGFAKKATFKYYGSAKSAAEALALSADYYFEVQGKERSSGDPVVDINIVDKPLMEAMREISISTGDGISVELLEGDYEGHKGKMIYRYK